MRKIKIWNKSISDGVALYDNSILVTDFQGFGSKFKVQMNNKKVRSIEPDFERMTLNLYFGVEGNAYDDYTDLIELITENGLNNLVIEYDYGEGSRYCDVVLETAPKTQKNTFGVLNETFVFQRLTPWYQYVAWMGGSLHLPYTKIIENTTPYNIELHFTFSSEPGETGVMQIKKLNLSDAEISRIEYNITESKSTVEIDAETKTVTKTHYSTGIETNTYDNLNHAYASFIIFEPGEKGKIRLESLGPYMDYVGFIYKFWLSE